MAEFDVLIVGSGPAGVSAAVPLLNAGLQVLLVDGGRQSTQPPPSGSFLAQRDSDTDQWKWMIGPDFHALRGAEAVSPKLRVPTHGFVFEEFASKNRIHPDGFIAVGSLARGGLSNAWGCGVARMSASELAAFPFPSEQLQDSYEVVARRVGLSGANKDDLADYFGVDQWAQAPVRMDALQSALFTRYGRIRERLTGTGFRLGRSRLAVLSQTLGERQACDLSGTCLWGCNRGALYTAAEDLLQLQRYTNFHYLPGFVVERVESAAGLPRLSGHGPDGTRTYSARRIILAAGTLASTRLALQTLGHTHYVPMQACPTAAFMLWLPRFLGQPREASFFGLGQLSFALSLNAGVSGFGSLFNPTGIPLSEFSRYLPLRKRHGIDLLSSLMSSCIVGNVFLPGHLTQASLRLRSDESLEVKGRYDERVDELMSEARRKLRRYFGQLGAVLLPMSFKLGQPGSDIHYACSLPMRKNPKRGETNAEGEVFGLRNIHVVDGSCLSALPEKSHTLTIMANADRISRHIVRQLRSECPDA